MSEFYQAYPIPPHRAQPSKGGFFLPPTMTTDFSKFLQQDTPGFTYTAKLIRNWEQREDPQLNPFIRCVLYPINWKSNFAAADEGVNFRTDFTHTVRKGDIVLREDGEYYLLNWAVHKQVNNQPSQAKRCNLRLTIVRTMPETTDEDGYLVDPGGDVTFIDQMPVCIYQYDGRPDYAVNFGNPGVVSDALTVMDLQWNPKTQQIVVNDEFLWGTSTYRVININMSGVNIAQDAGVLQLHCKRVAGGEQVG